jgi:hypothetical protein
MHAISEDGSQVVFTAEGKLFVREHAEREQSALNGKGECENTGDACTLQLDASHAGGTGGGGTFLIASSDGSHVFFMDNSAAKLTSDTTEGSGENLYEYDVETKTLTDLTPMSHADLLGVSGYGEEGASWYLYFAAKGKLVSGAAEGSPNLYVIHDGGSPAFIGTLADEDRWDWEDRVLVAKTAAGGALLAFDSIMPLTGYDNTPSEPGLCDDGSGHPEPCPEIYLYDAKTTALSCVSCAPSGAPPRLSGAELPVPSNGGFPAVLGPGYAPRDLLNNGTLFFDTSEALVPEDKNRVPDVYEYQDGELHLISSGKETEPSVFVEASANGENVFFATAQQLLSRNRNSAFSIYDAREDGGFPEPPLPLPGCSGEKCQLPPPSTLIFGVPPSIGFEGPGDLTVSATKEGTASRETRAERLRMALEICRRKTRGRRHSCEAKARKRFGAKADQKKGKR